MIVDSLLHIALLGATWVLYLLIGLSVVSFGSMFERFLFFRRNAADGDVLDEKLPKALGDNDLATVLSTLEKGTSIQARVLREAIGWRRGGPQAVADAVDSALGRARGELERSINLLGTLGNNAPFIGLFGTVIGVIEAFNHLGGGASDTGMAKVMAGIAEALIATGVGIFVAIPAVVAYNVIQKRVADIENHTQSLAKLITAWLRTYPEAASDVASAKTSSAKAAGAKKSAGDKRDELNLAVAPASAE